MATVSISTFGMSPNGDKDYCCSSCENRSIGVIAEFYCETCLEFLCGKCFELHDRLFNTHLLHARNTLSKWPLSKKVVEFLYKCEVHNDRNIEKFCAVHGELCCTFGSCLNHSHCTELRNVSEASETQPTDLQSAKIQSLLEPLKCLKNRQEANMQSMQGTYVEYERYMIKEMRKNIYSFISNCEHETNGHAKEDPRIKVNSILTDFDHCAVKEMKDEVMSLNNSIRSAIQYCILLQNDLTQLNEYMQKIRDNKELCVIVNIKCQHKIQQTLAVLGQSGQVFTVKVKSKHDVIISSDSDTCHITCICVLPDGHVLVTDNINKKVKLLNKQYQVICHWDALTTPWCICQITPSVVVVTLDDDTIHEVQFLSVETAQLVPVRKFTLLHVCRGIAHNQGDLFVTADTIQVHTKWKTVQQTIRRYIRFLDSYPVCCESHWGQVVHNKP
ncbi:uncharacterized protein LOC127836867 [Dreissena polymorpha]|uniref:B box-type domain-containing protein n=1 Tax=Dreissena polymorpha TaxID=45954 RepID=A0A9D4F9H5_DREPO|nr:uncharacterized protein LOC127836867 [Dreissena polymorpha]KAH3794172.1 hypothetical protein DPMN_147703 [Dreissena polymorpha]